jgi:hypothetical protein
MNTKIKIASQHSSLYTKFISYANVLADTDVTYFRDNTPVDGITLQIEHTPPAKWYHILFGKPKPFTMTIHINSQTIMAMGKDLVCRNAKNQANKVNG